MRNMRGGLREVGGGGKGRSGGVAEGNKGVKGVRLRGGGQVEERWDGEWWWAGGGGGGGGSTGGGVGGDDGERWDREWQS